MKYHKIKSVPLDVCTAEQKIAYNIAFSWRDCWIHACGCKDAAKYNAARLAQEAIASYKRNYPESKYDIDAIFSALLNGIPAYIEQPFIATSYEQIGRVFPALYK